MKPKNYVDVLEADDYMDMIIEARTNNGSIQKFSQVDSDEREWELRKHELARCHIP